MDINNIRGNKSTVFILPLLYPGIQFPDVIFENFINCYIADTTQPNISDSLIIEFDNNVCHFRIPKEYLDDYKKIIKSQYSKISPESKEIILYFWKESSDSLLYSILYKTEKVLDYWRSKFKSNDIQASEEKEYWTKFNPYEETKGLNHLYKSFNLKLTENGKYPVIK
jgi:hypothetical protein